MDALESGLNDLDSWDVPVEERLVSCAQVTELQCGICLDLLNDPCQCINGHLFCMTCILECIERKAECPQCRCQLSESSLSKSLFVRKFIDDLDVRCRYYYKQPFSETVIPNPDSCSDDEEDTGGKEECQEKKNVIRLVVRNASGEEQSSTLAMASAMVSAASASHSAADVRHLLVGGQSHPAAGLRSSTSEFIVRQRQGTTEKRFAFDPRGCAEKLHYADLRQHELRCGFAFVPCIFMDPAAGREQHFVRRHELAQHIASCPWRPQPCPYCSQMQACMRIKQHERECEERPVPCSECGAPVKSAQLQLHLTTECPEAVVTCPFESEGCKESMRRKHVESHIAASAGRHILLLKKVIMAQRMTIEEQAEDIAELNAERQSLRRALEQQPTGPRGTAYVARWAVDKFSYKRLLSFVQSHKFSFCGVTWYLGIYPNHGGASHISLYLFVAKSELPTGSLELAYDLIIINRDPARTVTLKHLCKFPLEAGDGWGSNQALPKSMLSEEEGFLIDDTLQVRMEARVRSHRVL
mmetsp:Transcript_15517/g.60691  ORF Transcript_15517/g.60691 Transcript_15517/m.60691 type:complete len:527 (-) Transcript_15517:32-1612(-)